MNDRLKTFREKKQERAGEFSNLFLGIAGIGIWFLIVLRIAEEIIKQ